MILELTLLIPGVLLAFYLWWTRHYKYWEKKGVACIPAKFPFGSIKDVMLSRKIIGKELQVMYNKFPDASLVGFYAPINPMVIVKDPELIKIVLVKDFSIFSDNGFEVHESVDPMIAYNPFGTKGEKSWKECRNLHTPVHTMSKLKAMVPLMWKNSKNMTKYLINQNGKTVKAYDVSSNYTTDNVAMCAYSVESDTFYGVNSDIKKFTSGQLFNNANKAALSAFFLPFAAKIFRFRTTSKVAEDFFTIFARSCLDHRRKIKFEGTDLIQLLVAAEEKRSQEGKPPFTGKELAAHLLTFFIDGSETSALALTNVLFQIASDMDVQERLRAEILQAGNKIEDFDFDKLWTLQYLEMVLCETFRVHPPFPVLSRICIKDTKLGNVKIDKGTKLFIPVLALHYDPKYYSDPDEFDPERFSKENKSNHTKYTFLPFGEGPRICLGSKFAQTQIKMAIVALLLKFRLILPEFIEKKKIVLDETSSFVLTFKEDVLIYFEVL